MPDDEALTRRLAELEAELGHLAYAISHDLRAPLRAVSGFAQALLEDHAPHLDASGQDYTRRVVAAAKRMDGMIEALLQYSRLARAEITLAPVALDAAAGEAVKKRGEAIATARAEVTVEAPMPSVVAHRATLTDAIGHLVDNAVKFVDGSRPPVVRLRAEARGERVRLFVEDNGIGIAASNLDKIFGVFERLHKPDQYPGPGIGLALARRAAARMGGEAGVESELGVGSRFWIELDSRRQT